MIYVNIGTGLFIILIGFLVKQYPDLIAGYNTMSSEQKRKVDVEGLSTWMRNSCIFMGGLMIAGGLLFEALAIPLLANNIILISTFTVLPITIVKAQQYDHNKTSKSAKYTTLVVLLVVIGGLVAGLLYYGMSTPTITMGNGIINVSGMYGINREVASIELVQNMPGVTLRTNGFALNETRKGHFRLENGSTAMLFLSSQRGPFIQLITRDKQTIYINHKDPEETNQLFAELQFGL